MHTAMKRIIFFGLFIITLAVLTGCDWYAGERIIYEDWLCTVKTDGTDLNYLRKSVGHHFVVTPDSERVILFSTGHIYSMNIDGSDFTTLNDSIGSYLYGGTPSVAETPEGTKIVFSNHDDIYKIDLESNELINLTNTPNIHEKDPFYSHDGTKIAYNTRLDSIITISMMDYDGENKRLIVQYKNPAPYYSLFRCPRFSLNDEKIFYIWAGQGNEINYGLYNVNVNGSNNQYISADVGDCFAFTPDRSKIVFCCYNNIYIMNADGLDLTNLGRADYYRPVISSDGSQILFSTGYVCIMNIDGTGRRKLIDDMHDHSCKTIAFLPDDRVMCTVQRRVQ
jgi:hypothetical protein